MGLEQTTTFVKLTDRGLPEAEHLAHFSIQEWPQNAQVLNLGSGTSQALEADIAEVRPDVKVTSIDPSIFLRNYRATESDGSSYKVTSQADVLDRIKGLFNRQRTVVAVAQALPLQSGAFEEVLDVRGPAMYCPNEESYLAYIAEVYRVLKPGRMAHISQVFEGEPILGDKADAERLQHLAEERLRKAGYLANAFIVPDGSINGKPDYRVGVMLLKPAHRPRS